jgi:hypothetical protein
LNASTTLPNKPDAWGGTRALAPARARALACAACALADLAQLPNPSAAARAAFAASSAAAPAVPGSDEVARDRPPSTSVASSEDPAEDSDAGSAPVADAAAASFFARFANPRAAPIWWRARQTRTRWRMPDMVEARLVVTGSRDHAATRRGDLSQSSVSRDDSRGRPDSRILRSGVWVSERDEDDPCFGFFKKPLEALSAKGEHHRARA